MGGGLDYQPSETGDIKVKVYVAYWDIDYDGYSGDGGCCGPVAAFSSEEKAEEWRRHQEEKSSHPGEPEWEGLTVDDS